MIGRAFLFAGMSLGGALLVASYLADLAPEAAAVAPPPVAPPPVEDSPPPSADVAASGYREASLRADAKGQYSADAMVNGSAVRMLVDTGATFVSVSAATASRLGLVPGPGAKWRIATANGESLASPVVLRNVSLGGLYMDDVEALILAPEAGDVNLLGASFLKRLVSVEQRDGALVLRQ